MHGKPQIHLGNFQPIRLLSHPNFKLHLIIGKRRLVIVDEVNDTFSITADIIDRDDEEVFMCCAFAKSNVEVAVVAGQSRIIKVFSLADSHFLFPLKGHGGSINTIKTGNTPGIIFTGSEDTSIRMWCLERQRTICIFGGIAGHRDQVLSLDISLCGTYLVSSSHDCTIKVWKIPGKCSSCNLFYIDKHVCGSDEDDILTIYFPVFSSSEIHRSFITCVRFFGKFIIAKGNIGKLVVFKPYFGTEILNSYDNSECFFIDEYVLDSTKLNFKFFVDHKNNKLMIGSGEEEGTFIVCNLDFMQDERKLWKGNSNRKSVIRDLSQFDSSLYILYDDNILQKIQF